MRTDFYLLPTSSLADRDIFVCRLIEKAFQAGNTLFVGVESKEQASTLDQLLWEFRAESFVPHGLHQGPIMIGTLASDQPADIWLNLTQTSPKINPPCQRLIEVIPKDPDWQTKARERFRQYREFGYTLNTHHVN